LPHHECDCEYEEPSHVAIESTWHAIKLSALDLLEDFKLTGIASCHYGDASNERVGSSN
jgi:hypothetical protein